jgi:hypothetical protein
MNKRSALYVIPQGQLHLYFNAGVPHEMKGIVQDEGCLCCKGIQMPFILHRTRLRLVLANRLLQKRSVRVKHFV